MDLACVIYKRYHSLQAVRHSLFSLHMAEADMGTFWIFFSQ